MHCNNLLIRLKKQIKQGQRSHHVILHFHFHNCLWVMYYAKEHSKCFKTICKVSLARATPVWKNRGLVTALHTTSSDRQNLDGSRE